MNPAIRQIAQARLTTKQWEVFELIHNHQLSMRATAHQLGISRTAAIDRYDAACLHLHRAGIKFTPDGRPYLEEHT